MIDFCPVNCYYNVKKRQVMIMQKAPPLCGRPDSCTLCAADQYLRLQHITVDSKIPPCVQEDSLFLYVESGQGTITINGVSFNLASGCFCWLQSYHVFSLEPVWDTQLQLLAVVYDYPLSNYMTFHNASAQQLRCFATALPVYQLSGQARIQVETLFAELAECNDDRDPGSSLMKCGILGQLSYVFFTLCEAYCTEQPYSPRKWPLGWVLALFIAFYCSEDLDPVVVADNFGISAATLNRELRLSTGMNFAQTLNRARVNLASGAILFSELSFHFISSYCGFRSEVAFYRSFKELRGMTPQEYRLRSVNAPGIPRKTVSESVERILFYMHANYKEQISLKSMAQDLYISENIIRALLRDHLNTDFKTILTGFRIRYAKALLVVTKMPILDISLASGFNSERTFSRLFHQHCGMSPSAYRAEIGRAQA